MTPTRPAPDARRGQEAAPHSAASRAAAAFSAMPQNGTTPTQQRDPEKAERTTETSDSTTRGQNGPFLVRLARHFCGIRGDRALPTPLIRPLRHLSPDLETYLLTFLGTFPSILIACAISYGLSGITSSAFTLTPLTVGSFGATAVLLYATPEAPLSQPRNVIGGQTLSAIVGAVISQLFALNDKFTNSLASGQDNTIATADSWPSLVPLSGAFAVGVATLVMQLTGTVHPPGGATALIAAYHRTAGPRYTYILDVFLSITAMTIWAIFVNNLGRRRYPTHWLVPKKPAPAPAPPSTPPAPEALPTSSASSSRSLAPPLKFRSLSRSRSGVSPRLDPAADLDLDPVSLAADEELARSLRSRSPSPSPNRAGGGRGGVPLEEVFTPLEDAERRWVGRLGEEDEEALGGRDEQARREAIEWERRRSLERQAEQRRKM
ncbi:hypothetical protein JCM8115_005471 [Rhodotorula mucilaginosa]|uniref:HPP transmembrane region domain-containing protein n=1 Tax=Rhodotorula mucilaginosa TaxID=5537 RepID=A0A9P7B7F3_RHOMI|nr:hypothetical protein C6P46_001694 [Rhodotorula mucilaginosa]